MVKLMMDVVSCCLHKETGGSSQLA